MLRIEVGTHESGDEVFVYDVALDTDKFSVLEAINTLYGTGVTYIAMYPVEKD